VHYALLDCISFWVYTAISSAYVEAGKGFVPMKKILVFAVLGALMIAPVLATTANASLLQIICGGLDLVYDGSAIYDAGSPLGGSGNPAESDVLDSMTFKLKDVGPPVTLLQLNTNIFADVFIGGVYNIPKAGGMIMSTGPFGGFGFDLLVKNAVPGWGLGLNLTGPLQITFDGQSLNVLASGVTTGIVAQDMPPGLGVTIGSPVQISFSTAILSPNDIADDGQFLTYFASSGSGEVSGPATAVPEPGTLLLLGMGLLGGGITRRRLRK
jgi:hypothetical protein